MFGINIKLTVKRRQDRERERESHWLHLEAAAGWLIWTHLAPLHQSLACVSLHHLSKSSANHRRNPNLDENLYYSSQRLHNIIPPIDYSHLSASNLFVRLYKRLVSYGPLFTTNWFGTCCFSACVRVCVRVRVYCKPFDVHWQTHTPFLASHCCTFLTPTREYRLERVLYYKDFQPCKAFSWPHSLEPGIHFPLGAAPGLWLEPGRGEIGLPPSLSAAWLNGTWAIVIHSVAVSTSTLPLWIWSPRSWVMCGRTCGAPYQVQMSSPFCEWN